MEGNRWMETERKRFSLLKDGDSEMRASVTGLKTLLHPERRGLKHLAGEAAAAASSSIIKPDSLLFLFSLSERENRKNAFSQFEVQQREQGGSFQHDGLIPVSLYWHTGVGKTFNPEIQMRKSFNWDLGRLTVLLKLKRCLNIAPIVLTSSHNEPTRAVIKSYERSKVTKTERDPLLSRPEACT